MTDALASFLAQRRAAHGAWNCSTLAADWCVSQGYPDFAARWRTTTDPVACEAAAPDTADLVDLWVRDIGGGLPQVEAVARGDIGVVEMLGRGVGGIFTGRHWVLAGNRTLHFIASSEVTILRAWRP